MEFKHSLNSIAELKEWQSFLKKLVLGLLVLVLTETVFIFNQSKIIVIKTPGIAGEAWSQNSALDRISQKSIILSTVSAMTQIKRFIQTFLSPSLYTEISLQMDIRVKKMQEQRELGSMYFEFKEYEFDPELNKHFVKGEVHTVNVAKNTAQMWVYELQMEVENYLPLITSLQAYPGDEFHDALWMSRHTTP
jgi:hypothetical protein